MITLIVAARRKAGMSREEFNRHWLEHHAPLVLSVPEFSRHLRKYALYPLAEDGGGNTPALGALPDYDGVGELWFESREAMLQAFSEPRYLEIIRPDEDIFLDRDACLTFVTEERVMKAGMVSSLEGGGNDERQAAISARRPRNQASFGAL